MSDEYTVAVWSEHPYTSYDKRSREVRHRVKIIRYNGHAYDIIHQRSEAGGSWVDVKAIELRQHGVTEHTIRDGVMEE